MNPQEVKETQKNHPVPARPGEERYPPVEIRRLPADASLTWKRRRLLLPLTRRYH